MAKSKGKINPIRPSVGAYDDLRRIQRERNVAPDYREVPYAEIIDEWRLAAKEHEQCSTKRYQRAIAEPPRRVLDEEAADWAMQFLQSISGAKSEYVQAIKEVVEAALLDRVPQEASAQYPNREVDPLSQKAEAVGRDPLHPKKGRKGLEGGERRTGSDAS